MSRFHTECLAGLWQLPTPPRKYDSSLGLIDGNVLLTANEIGAAEARRMPGIAARLPKGNQE